MNFVSHQQLRCVVCRLLARHSTSSERSLRSSKLIKFDSLIRQQKCSYHSRHDFFNRHPNNDSLLHTRHRNRYLLIQKRDIGGIVFRIVRGALKIRYLVLGSAVGGGVTLSKVRLKVILFHSHLFFLI